MSTLTDTEREEQIVYCGQRMQECMTSGHRETADEWRQRMEQHIRERSPGQIARMEQERGLSGSSCYFDTMGQIDREAMPAILRRQAA